MSCDCTNAKELIVYDASGNEVEWIDPVEDLGNLEAGWITVDNGYHTYTVRIPEGGRYIVREMWVRNEGKA